MIKLPKKVMNAITREFSSDITIIKRVYIHSMFKELCVNLIAEELAYQVKKLY